MKRAVTRAEPKPILQSPMAVVFLAAMACCGDTSRGGGESGRDAGRTPPVDASARTGETRGDSGASGGGGGGGSAGSAGASGGSADSAGASGGAGPASDAGGDGGDGGTASGDAGVGDAGVGDADGQDGSGGVGGEAVLDSCVPKACGDPCEGCGADACRCSRLAACERDEPTVPLDCAEPTDCPTDPPTTLSVCSGLPRGLECTYGDCRTAPQAGRTFASCNGGEWQVTEISCDGYACVGSYGSTFCEANEICYEYQGGSPGVPQCLPNGCGDRPPSCECLAECDPSRCTLDGRHLTCTCGAEICP